MPSCSGSRSPRSAWPASSSSSSPRSPAVSWRGSCNATVALAAFLFAAYLLAVQLVVLDAICQWCVATDVLTTALAALALVRLGPASSGG